MNNNWKDYYEILEVSQTASLNEIKKSYRELIKKYHPDISKEKNATERFLEIQEAYDILSDDKKRASYDLNYESNKNGKFQNKDTYEENVDYDEVINEYDKRTRDYAEKMAIKKVIEETISKAEKIIELKNDIILSAYENDITETDYEENLEALIEIYNEYQEELEQLCQKAIEKGLDYLVPNIEQASTKIEEELKGIPLTILDAINYVEDELVGESIKQQINLDITTCQQINQKLDNFFNQLGNGIIDEKNYKAYYDKFKLEIKSTMVKLLNMKKLTKLFSMNKEFNIVNKLMTEISTKEISLPETYGEAKITAKVIILNKNISTFSNKVKLYKSTATKAERMLNLNPYDVKGFEEAYLAEKLFEEIKDDYKALKKETDSLEILKNIEVLEDIFKSSYDILNQTRKDLKEVKSSTGMFVIMEAKKQYKKNHSVDSKTRNKIAEKTRDILKISEDITKLSSYEELYNKAQAYIDIINCTSSGYMPHKEKLELAYHEGYDCYEHLEDIIMYYENELFDACFHSLSYGEALTKSLFCAAIKLAYTLFIELVVHSIVPRVVLKYLNLIFFCMCLKRIFQDILEVRKSKKNGKDYQKIIDSNLVLKKKYDRYLNSR